MRIEIKNRFSGSVIWAHEARKNSRKVTVEAAVKAGINLNEANLVGVNLEKADLTKARLSGANLKGACLSGAYLARADLSGANLERADLSGAYLAGADLTKANLTRALLDTADLTRANLNGANLAWAYLVRARLRETNLAEANLKSGERLIGKRPIFQVGPIQGHHTYFVAYLTNKGLRFDIEGRSQVSREDFEQYLLNVFGDRVRAKEYWEALALIDGHAKSWIEA